ncbi:MAG: hypothetical protein LM571_04635 [Desulfurococcaceae archaeon]|nr:hypothetical protein [Desulfurococcaceae archaeon]
MPVLPDVSTLFRNLERNILRRDRISKRLRQLYHRVSKEEDYVTLVEYVKSLRISRRALLKVLRELREAELYGDYIDLVETMVDYMHAVGIHIEREVLIAVSEILERSELTKEYVDEIRGVDMVELDELMRELGSTLEFIRTRARS